MPKRRRRRKRRAKNSVMKQRLGLLNKRGSRPYHAWSKTITEVTLGHGTNPGTTAGAIFHLPVNNWNDPLGTLATLTSGAGTLVAGRHPRHHVNAILDGYNAVQVLSWQMKMWCNWIKADAPNGDFFVGYIIRDDANTEVTLVADGTAERERLDMMTSPRWTLKHYRAVQGFREVRPNSEAIVINIPNVYAYGKILAGGASVVAFGPRRMSHQIADVASTVNPPGQTIFCTVCIMTESGLAMAIDSVDVTIEITQKVRIMRNALGSGDLNEGQPDSHA